MNKHAIAAVLAAVSLSAFAQPGAPSSGSAPPRADGAQTVHRAPGALPPAGGFILAKIDQNNTPPDRGGDPSGRQHSGMKM
ncbi:hypothetical protein [Burkholderia sp. Ac-20353]|uniref:hypothetical protein n=1 Tax=Burkholderia sp. Ac-20353 TaxID=2703894 RepID=UPI00197B6825|nr:hypothetical protein [Burkholderia sp. Ac-20353]MBN3790490.1 hypothetical protein [Burkholderia sp. Ac-20353]